MKKRYECYVWVTLAQRYTVFADTEDEARNEAWDTAIEGEDHEIIRFNGEITSDTIMAEEWPLTDAEISYLTTALWSSTYQREDEPGDDIAMDEDFGIEDFDEESLGSMLADLHDFFDANRELIRKRGRDDKAVAHDFWLTRNGHGAGFWDGDYPEDIGEKLTEAAHVYGSIDLLVGDDGKIYC